MTKQCSKCGLQKAYTAFHFRKDNGNYRNQCKVCWKYLQSARRLNISFEVAKAFYESPSCMCCSEPFLTKRGQNLHHVNHIVYGVLCHYCNIALEQERPETLHRLQACLAFMSRKNLFDKVDQPVRQKSGRPVTSTTLRQTSDRRQCKTCGLWLPMNQFYRQKYYTSDNYGHTAQCKHCYKIYVKAQKYGLTFDQIDFLQSCKYCACCGVQFTKKNCAHIHHNATGVKGSLCRKCNSLLEQENDITRTKLEACINWFSQKMIKSELAGNSKRQAEMTCPYASK
jgi:hypothetical protein